MKSLFIATVLVFSLSTIAQQTQSFKNKPDFSPEQRAELQTKRLTLLLDLDNSQIRKIEALQLERIRQKQRQRENRKSLKYGATKPSDDMVFAIKNKRLEQRIAYQKEMQQVLSESQYTKWKNIQRKHHKKKKYCQHNKKINQQ